MTTNLLSVIEQLVGALENHSGNYKLTKSEAQIQEAVIAAGKQALEQTQGEDSDDVTISVDYFEKLECCRRLLEIIATGDSEDPRKDAEDELIAHGFWNPAHPQATEPISEYCEHGILWDTVCRSCDELPAPALPVGWRTDTDRFKNFHRSLCARFGYTHDEKDWRRDLVSLEEYIAALLFAPALPAAAMQLADDFAAAAVNHYSAGENDKALWQKMVDARQALETKLMEVK